MRRGRKGNDLFQLLQVRARGGAVPRRGRSESVSTLGAVREWVGSLWAPPQKSHRRGSVGRSKSSATAILPVAGLALACVALGFWLGRITVTAAGGTDLRAPGGTGRTDPGLLQLPNSPVPGAADLTAAQEIETLSKFFVPLLSYAEPERRRASDLAHYLRTQGLGNTRIKLSVSENRRRWYVLVYLLESEKDSWTEQRELLAAVKNPPFEAQLESRVNTKVFRLP